MIIDINEDKSYINGYFQPTSFENERYIYLNFENLEKGKELKVIDDFINFYSSITELKNYTGKFLSNFTNTQTSIKAFQKFKTLMIHTNKMTPSDIQTKVAMFGLTEIQKNFLNSMAILYPKAKMKAFNTKEEALKWLMDDLRI